MIKAASRDRGAGIATAGGSDESMGKGSQGKASRLFATLLLAVFAATACLGTTGSSSATASATSTAPSQVSAAGKAASTSARRKRARTSTAKKSTAKKTATAKKATTTAKKATTRRRRRTAARRRAVASYRTSSFTENQTEGDVADGEDPLVREAAIEALGGMNGSILAIDPESGRILAMVNQKLALSAGAIPCSTIKVPVALAALSEGIVNRDTEVALNRRVSMTLSQALAVSNNNYFEILGRRLGFEKVAYYERQFGLGELAGIDIDGEQPGTYPDKVLDARLGGVGKMCSFGEGIEVTPLQLGALLSAVANGGTLYYLQHPRSAEEIASFTPHVKRYLEIGSLIPELQEGLRGAVEHGTARTVAYNFHEEAILGKTGTCSENHTRYGWFASFANTSAGKVAVVVFLQGGYGVSGPKAAELAGKMYRRLYDGNYFGPSNTIQAEHRESRDDSGESTVRGVSQ
jgi:penicillin-binding protein 2